MKFVATFSFVLFCFLLGCTTAQKDALTAAAVAEAPKLPGAICAIAKPASDGSPIAGFVHFVCRYVNAVLPSDTIQQDSAPSQQAGPRIQLARAPERPIDLYIAPEQADAFAAEHK